MPKLKRKEDIPARYSALSEDERKKIHDFVIKERAAGRIAYLWEAAVRLGVCR